MSDHQVDAQEALFQQITRVATNDRLEAHNLHVQATILRDLALAYRFAAGGPQPAFQDGKG